MKAKCFFIVALFVSAIVSCSTDSSENSNQRSAQKKAIEDSLRIVKQVQDSLNQIYVDSIRKENEARIAHENRPWKLSYYVDNFGDPTDEKYIYTYLTGTFSNSATTNSDLWVKIFIEKSISGLFLIQYSPDQQAEKFIGGGKMLLKNQAGDKIDLFIGGDWNQRGGIRIESNNHSKLISYLKKNPGEIKAVVYDDYSSVYRFSIKGDGFIEEFKLLDKK